MTIWLMFLRHAVQEILKVEGGQKLVDDKDKKGDTPLHLAAGLSNLIFNNFRGFG